MSTLPPLPPPRPLACTCGTVLKVLHCDGREYLACDRCEVVLFGSHLDQQKVRELMEEVRHQPPPRQEVDPGVVCRTCGRSATRGYDWVASRGECSTCRRRGKRTRRRTRELRSMEKRKAARVK